MKNLYTIGLIILHLYGFAQTPIVASFSMDYGMVDKIKAAKLSTSFEVYPALLNTRWGNDSLTFRNALVLFDSIFNPDYANLEVTSYPRNATQLTLECVDIYLRHSNVTQNYDSLRVIVCDRDSIVLTGTNSNQWLVTNSVWDTLIVTNISFIKNVLINGTQYTKFTFYPNRGFAKGKTFGIRVDFTGDTANHFELLSTYRDDCNGSCLASRAASDFNSLYLTSYQYSNQNYYQELYSDCNSNGRKDANGCELFYIQNWWIAPCVTVVADTSYSIPVGISTLDTEEHSVRIYPNPSADGSQITVHSSMVNAMMDVYDTNGRLVFFSKLMAQSSQLHMPLSKGVYFIRIHNEQASVVKRWVKL